jgi:hypothetical protein
MTISAAAQHTETESILSEAVSDSHAVLKERGVPGDLRRATRVKAVKVDPFVRDEVPLVLTHGIGRSAVLRGKHIV